LSSPLLLGAVAQEILVEGRRPEPGRCASGRSSLASLRRARAETAMADGAAETLRGGKVFPPRATRVIHVVAQRTKAPEPFARFALIQPTRLPAPPDVVTASLPSTPGVPPADSDNANDVSWAIG
jgi:hypothetical protein